jgi:crotonobetainyl-CoA:carnitine CoA-transferase CaiB-like acyl-CoA transferase
VLSGLKVLDFTRVLAGPLCTMILGDMGADVIKVERPRTGDETRGWGPPFDAAGRSAYFLAINRNKRSVAIDLETPEGRELVEQLLATADIAVDNFLPGALDRLGLEPQRSLERNPALIWCSITGFGAESRRPGYDFVVQAERGWMAITGDRDGTPTKVGVALADVLAGKDAAITILAALAQRGRTGRGGHHTVSLAQSAAAGLVNVAQNALVSGEEPQRWGNAHPNLVPYQLFDARDRAIVIAVGSDSQWHSCAMTLGLDAEAADEQLRTNAGRVARRSDLVRTMADVIRRRPAAHWLARLAEAGVPAGVVKGVLEMLREVECSPITGVAPSVPGSVRREPPALDQHGDEIRRSGWDPSLA